MRYKTLPHRFPLEVSEVKTKHKKPKSRRKKSLSAEIPNTVTGVATVVQAKDKFLAKLPFVAYKIYKFGERGSGYRVKGDIQDFYKIRDECIRNEVLWEDPEFPAIDSSVYFTKTTDTNFEWKRPMDIVDDPQFFVEGVSRFDIQQGKLGDCWFVAAIVNLTLYPKVFFQIVPEDQSFTEKYAGVFHFRFWQYGRWIDVVIDDRLPTYRGQLTYTHSTEKNEFWGALLEKAYAKLHGCYEALTSGSLYEAMEDFTGGVTEMYELDATCPPNLFKILLKAFERSSLLGCSLKPDPNLQQLKTPEGLILGHEYSITDVKLVETQIQNSKRVVSLLRIRNPWGKVEWSGAWSDQIRAEEGIMAIIPRGINIWHYVAKIPHLIYEPCLTAPEWQYVPKHVKEKMDLTFKVDGEFWMSYDDFKTYFQRVQICNLTPDSLIEDELLDEKKKKWEMSVFEGEWVRGVTAGGCRHYLDTFCHNPQYRITLMELDEGDYEDKSTVIIALMQKNRRQKRKLRVDFLTIGFVVYHLPHPERVPIPLDKTFFMSNQITAVSPEFINIREVCCRFKLSPGTYCIVPSTYEPNEEAEFLLRVFSENKNNMEENDEEVCLHNIDTKVKERLNILEEQRETDKSRELFLKLAGEDMEVDWMELKSILDYTMRAEIKEGFSEDICRSMVAMMDTDYSGKLGFEEFKLLWTDIICWRFVFKLYNKSGTNQLCAFELRQALKSAGYNLNNHILNILVHRYGTKDGCITFDDFIMCVVRLKAMIDLFRTKDPNNTDEATFFLEEWVRKTVYS